MLRSSCSSCAAPCPTSEGLPLLLPRNQQCLRSPLPPNAIGASLLLSPCRAYAAAKTLVFTVGAIAGGAVVVLVSAYVATSPTFGWTGRSLSLLDPTYASKYIPIIASVSEHQPPCWSSFFNDLHMTVLLAPAGLISCFLPLTDASLFLAVYAITAVYFSGVMVRLMLVLAPAMCCLAGVSVSEALDTCAAALKAKLLT